MAYNLKILLKFSVLILPIAAILSSSSLPESGESQECDIKFHPGHYVAVGPFFELPEIKYIDEPALQGVNKRYYWRTLEPEEGIYDFSSIEKDLEYLSRHKKQLIVFLIDRTFWKKGGMPGYLSEFERKYDGGNFVPVRWDPEVVNRFIALGKAIGERFDSHPNFEGVATQESSLGLSEEDYLKYGYSPDKYRDALITILTGIQQSMPNSHVFWYQNFMHDDRGGVHLRQIADTIIGSGIIMGGPDILPYNLWYNKKSYPMYREYKDKLTLFCSAQDDSYKHYINDVRVSVQEPIDEKGYLTMEEVFLFARDSLNVRYLFWNYYFEGVGKGERSYNDAIEVIRKYPTFNNSVGPD